MLGFLMEADPKPNETWAVYRQDDTGNQYIVETGLSREKAETLVAMYEARGHKQLYWAEREKSCGPTD